MTDVVLAENLTAGTRSLSMADPQPDPDCGLRGSYGQRSKRRDHPANVPPPLPASQAAARAGPRAIHMPLPRTEPARDPRTARTDQRRRRLQRNPDSARKRRPPPRTWMYPMHPHHDDDRLLTPREAALIFGVRTTTIARWSREGRLPSFLTPGGHRRYRLPDVHALLETDNKTETDQDRQTAEDAVRLYDQGWSIRQVAEKFDLDYTTMRRLLKRNGVHFRRQGKTSHD